MTFGLCALTFSCVVCKPRIQKHYFYSYRMEFYHELKESCGVFGVFGHKDAAKLTYFGLYALQHRGQESAGIVSSTGKSIYEHKGMGDIQ